MKVEEALTHARSIFYAYMTICGILTLLAFRSDPRENYTLALEELDIIDQLDGMQRSPDEWLSLWPTKPASSLVWTTEHGLKIMWPPDKQTDDSSKRCVVPGNLVEMAAVGQRGGQDYRPKVTLSDQYGHDCVRCQIIDKSLVEATGSGEKQLPVRDMLTLFERPQAFSFELDPISQESLHNSIVILASQVTGINSVNEPERGFPWNLAEDQCRWGDDAIHVFIGSCSVQRGPDGVFLGKLAVSFGDEEGVRGEVTAPLKQQDDPVGLSELLGEPAADFRGLRSMPNDILEASPTMARARIETRRDNEAAGAPILGVDIPLWLLRLSSGLVVLLLAIAWAIHMHHVAKHYGNREHADAIARFPWIVTFEGQGYRILTLVLVIGAPLLVTMTGPLVSYHIHHNLPHTDSLEVIGLMLSYAAAGIGGYTVHTLLGQVRQQGHRKDSEPGRDDYVC